MSVSAYIRIPVGPVPLTMQTFAVLTAGYTLGAGCAAASVMLYIVVGLMGLPVFSTGGGPAYVLSPTFGYLIGFAFCAAVTGFLARFNRRESVLVAYAVMIVGMTTLYLPGVAWLVVSLHWIADVPASVASLMKIGLFVPFAGDAVTAVPAAILSVRLRKILS